MYKNWASNLKIYNYTMWYSIRVMSWPIVILIYINDLPNATKYQTTCTLFADDTVVI